MHFFLLYFLNLLFIFTYHFIYLILEMNFFFYFSFLSTLLCCISSHKASNEISSQLWKREFVGDVSQVITVPRTGNIEIDTIMYF